MMPPLVTISEKIYIDFKKILIIRFNILILVIDPVILF